MSPVKTSTVGTHVNTYRDASGLITVSVFSRKGSPARAHWIDEEVLVGDPDMVAIGGGGKATNTNNGALLTASYPK